MGYLDNFNQAQKAGIFEHWLELNDEQQLQEILEVSKTKPVVIFKHSTTCGISEGAKYALMDNWDFSDQDLDLYYLDLLKYRSISNRVAEDFAITHQSPQVLLIKDGKVAAYTSHHRIGVQWLKDNL
ncbi:bacillithiol system redox-active protein YtxJ [Haliscomenobacter sp.]|uniref:bacillithiol system redox-active protein YtxJ n=1 Tax=Haliscomenobacter sp. TaxID=2717303 RepID=UPI003364DF8E